MTIKQQEDTHLAHKMLKAAEAHLKNVYKHGPYDGLPEAQLQHAHIYTAAARGLLDDILKDDSNPEEQPRRLQRTSPQHYGGL